MTELIFLYDHAQQNAKILENEKILELSHSYLVIFVKNKEAFEAEKNFFLVKELLFV